MANSNAMARIDADKNHVGASVMVIDSAGDVGKIAFNGKIMAWVNFDGTLSSLSPRASANVSSITDLGTGKYSINFASPLPDTDYGMAGNSLDVSGGASAIEWVDAPDVSAARIWNRNSGVGMQDNSRITVVFFR